MGRRPQEVPDQPLLPATPGLGTLLTPGPETLTKIAVWELAVALNLLMTSYQGQLNALRFTRGDTLRVL